MGLTKEQRAAKAAPQENDMAGLPVDGEALKPCAADDGLTAMLKGGEELRVHPSCVKAHQAAGWHCKD